MKKIFFILLLAFTQQIFAQSLSSRVTYTKSPILREKVKAAMIVTSVNILRTPLPLNQASADSLTAKKEFAKKIVKGDDIEDYIYAILITGQVTPMTSDNVIYYLVGLMMDGFVAYKQEQN